MILERFRQRYCPSGRLRGHNTFKLGACTAKYALALWVTTLTIGICQQVTPVSPPTFGLSYFDLFACLLAFICGTAQAPVSGRLAKFSRQPRP